MVYKHWCYTNGWIVTGDKINTVKKRVQSNDDPEWSEDNRFAVVHRTTFCRWWEEHFKNVKIASVSKDTCGTCWDLIQKLNNLRKGTRCDAGVGEVGEVAAPDESTIVNAANNDTNALVAVYNVEPSRNRVTEGNQDRTPGSPYAVQDEDDVLLYEVNNFPNEFLQQACTQVQRTESFCQ